MSILVVMEQRAVEGPPAWSRMSWETLAAGQQLARELQQPVSAAVLGQGIESLAAELADKQLEHVYAVEHDLLERLYAGHLHGRRAPVSGEDTKPRVVIFPHTYQVRDFLPKLATALGTCSGKRCGGASRRRRQTGAGAPAFSRQAECRCALHRRAALFRFDAGGRLSRRSGSKPDRPRWRSSRRSSRRSRIKPLELFREARARWT